MTRNESFLRELNEAFARNDTAFILAGVTDDIRWTIIGDRVITGKKSFATALNEMAGDRAHELTIHHIITHGRIAAANGVMTSKTEGGEVTTVAFCDVYRMSGFKKAKVSEITSYTITTAAEP